MKNCIALFLLTLIVAGCNSITTQLQERISDVDSIAINYFKGDGTMDTVVAVKIIKDSISIKKLSAFILESKAAEKNNCGVDGSIHFFKNDMVIQDVFFNSSKEECLQFRFDVEGKQAITKLSTEAKAFLLSVKNR